MERVMEVARCCREKWCRCYCVPSGGQSGGGGGEKGKVDGKRDLADTIQEGEAQGDCGRVGFDPYKVGGCGLKE